MVTASQAIREIVTELGRVVSAREIIQIINERYPKKWKVTTINAHLYGCSVNNPPAYTQHPSKPKFLFDHGRRGYELYDSKKHGKWNRGYPVGERPPTEVPEETETEEMEIFFGLERDLEEHIARNLDQLEEGLRLYSAEGISGRQYNTDVGRIDLSL